MKKEDFKGIEEAIKDIAERLPPKKVGIPRFFRRDLDEIAEEQVEISRNQTEFSKILTLATIVLAISAFISLALQIMNLPSEFYTKIYTAGGFWVSLLFFVSLLGGLAIMGIIIYIIFSFFGKKKRR